MSKTADLVTILNTTQLQQKDNRLYQVILNLIKNLQEAESDIAGIDTTEVTPSADLSGLEYLTASDETADLPNSRELLAGTGVSFDDTVPNERTINVAVSSTRAITFVVSGGGATITPGLKYGVYIPYACTITEVTLGADQTGDIVCDLWLDSYANFPPTSLDSIVGSANPEISGSNKSQDNVLSGWDPDIPAGSWLYLNIDSVTDIQYLMMTLTVQV